MLEVYFSIGKQGPMNDTGNPVNFMILYGQKRILCNVTAEKDAAC